MIIIVIPEPDLKAEQIQGARVEVMPIASQGQKHCLPPGLSRWVESEAGISLQVLRGNLSPRGLVPILL